MTDPVVEPQAKTHDSAIAELCKLLINSVIKESESAYGDTPRDRLTNHVKSRTDERMMQALDAFSAYRVAQASERQAVAMESLAKTAKTLQLSESVDTTAQAMVDERESKRDYLATTYRLDHETLTFLWALRGLLVDASIKSLSKPDRFDPYRSLTTEEIAWSLRLDEEGFYQKLPLNTKGGIDYRLLEDFDIMRYGGTDNAPDVWLWGG